MENAYVDSIERARELLAGRAGVSPKVGVVLGSGWGLFADALEGAARVPYREVPGFPESGVIGHAGEWVFGTLGGVGVAAMSGRFHPYEGHDPRAVTLPIRVMKALGIEALILTNAAGGVNERYAVGDLMLISDHINLAGQNPLTGPNIDTLGVRFPDMTAAYDPEYRELAKGIARKLGFYVREGVYAQMSGPSFETPAEIRMLRFLGADAVGMSTVPEAIVAAHAGLRVLGISCITNMAAGISGDSLSHVDVIETGRKAADRIVSLLKGFVEAVGAKSGD